MFKHEDKEFEYIVNLLAQQRDYAMGQAAVLYKENVALKAQVEALTKTEPKNDDAN